MQSLVRIKGRSFDLRWTDGCVFFWSAWKPCVVCRCIAWMGKILLAEWMAEKFKEKAKEKKQRSDNQHVRSKFAPMHRQGAEGSKKPP